jgi:hypothetical protein
MQLQTAVQLTVHHHKNHPVFIVSYLFIEDAVNWITSIVFCHFPFLECQGYCRDSYWILVDYTIVGFTTISNTNTLCRLPSRSV